jgi:hypothetical protein
VPAVSAQTGKAETETKLETITVQATSSIMIA